MKKETTSAIIGVVTGSDPIEYVGRLVMNDGDRAGKALVDSCPSVFSNIEALSRFVLSYHWVGITRCDLSKPPMSAAEFAPIQTKSVTRPPVYLGEKAMIVGLEGEHEFLTQEDKVWFAEYLHLVYVPSFKLASYRRQDDGSYSEIAAYDLKFADLSVPWKPALESSDQQ